MELLKETLHPFKIVCPVWKKGHLCWAMTACQLQHVCPQHMLHTRAAGGWAWGAVGWAVVGDKRAGGLGRTSSSPFAFGWVARSQWLGWFSPDGFWGSLSYCLCRNMSKYKWRNVFHLKPSLQECRSDHGRREPNCQFICGIFFKCILLRTIRNRLFYQTAPWPLVRCITLEVLKLSLCCRVVVHSSNICSPPCYSVPSSLALYSVP